jgi:PTS system nitrogen regulatory IIA component
MGMLAKLVPTGSVILDLDVTSKKRVFEQAGMLFESRLGLPHTQVYDALFARERLGSTGMGQGIAIPHGRLKGLKEAAGAFLRTRTPIPFEAPDGKPVNMIFVLLVPEKSTDQHLMILAELAEMFSERDTRAGLAAAVDAHQARDLIAEWEPHAPSQHRATV